MKNRTRFFPTYMPQRITLAVVIVSCAVSRVFAFAPPLSKCCVREKKSGVSSNDEGRASAASTLSHSPTALLSANEREWEVYVCECKQCKERGAGATLGAFIGLAPPDVVSVHPAIISKPKAKGPNIRCIQRGEGEGGGKGKFFEVNNVDSVEKVHRVLSTNMEIEGIDDAACECLKWNYRGNAHLDKGEISQAIKAYDKAIATGYRDQEGVLLVMRATAYLQRAFNHRKELKAVVSTLTETVPEPSVLQTMYQVAMDEPALANPILAKVVSDCRAQNKKFQQTKFRRGLYEYALLHATEDSLRATQLLPRYAKTWLRAGDSLAELRKLKESAQYYEKALELDPSLADALIPTIDRLKKSQEFLDQARSSGWPEDTLRVALDVAG